MAVHIRLQRHGKTNASFYHIVACDSRSPRDGRFIEKIGVYDSNLNPSKWNIKTDRLQYWYENGAVLSTAVANMVKKDKIAITRQKSAPKS